MKMPAVRIGVPTAGHGSTKRCYESFNGKKNMKIIDIEQGTSEWKDLRRQHVCASDVAAILGESKYKSAKKIYRDKVFGEEEQENEFMREGKDREPRARQYIGAKLKIDFKPIVAISEAYPWIMASLDGWSDTHSILEIKCPMRYESFLEIKKMVKEPPKDYFWQIQTQMLVTDSDTAFLGYYVDEPIVNNPESREIIVFRDEAMIAKIINDTQKFWFENVLEYVEPPNKQRVRRSTA